MIIYALGECTPQDGAYRKPQRVFMEVQRMKLKVEKQFRDKLSGELRMVDDVFEVDEVRGKELLEHPMELVTVVAEDVKKEEKSKPKSKPKTASKAKSKKSE